MNLQRIVRQKTHGFYPQIPENLGTDIILPQILVKAQGQVGLHRIHPAVLKLIGPQLIDQADAPAFLAHIEHNAPALFLDLAHGRRELLAAVTAQGAEGVSCQALRMHPAQQVLPVGDIALYQRHVMLPVQLIHITVGPEISVFGGHLHIGHPLYQLVMDLPVLLQLGDGDQADPMLFGKGFQLRSTHHGAVLPHDLAAKPALL